MQVVAGTVVRRWNGKGGGRHRGLGVLFPTPRAGQREVANVQLASSAGASGHNGADVRRVGSFGGAVWQAGSAGVKFAGAGGRAAGTGRRAKRAEARAESPLRRVRLVLKLMRFSPVVLRVHPLGSHVPTLHSIICVLFTALPSLHVIHTRVCLMHDVW